MKKVLALVLALILTLALGVAAFAEPAGGGITNVWGDGEGEPDFDFEAFPIWLWDINSENAVVLPYDYGDFATLISGSEAYSELFGEDYLERRISFEDTLSSIKVESEKGLIDVTVYKLDDYVKDIPEMLKLAGYDMDLDWGIKTKSNWPFEDFDLEDLVESYEGYPFYVDDDGDVHLDLYFIYFDFPTYAGAKVSSDNYFTLKFRDNTTGGDNVKTSKKVWFCVFPWAVDESDVETYADEDEAMELTEGEPMIAIGDELWDDLFDNLYKNVPDWYNVWMYGAGQGYGRMATVRPIEYTMGYDFTSEEFPSVITKDAWKEIVGSTLTVGVDDGLEVEIGKIVKGQASVNFLYKTKVEKDVQALDEDAELAALRFLDTVNVLDSDFTISYTFEIEDAAKAGEYFLYELVGDELKLVKKVAVGKGDDEVDVEIERKAGDTLGQYYLSDVELNSEAAPAEEEENPNTGIGEAAGVAVALAVVSLISAAAVALKK